MNDQRTVRPVAQTSKSLSLPETILDASEALDEMLLVLEQLNAPLVMDFSTVPAPL